MADAAAAAGAAAAAQAPQVPAAGAAAAAGDEESSVDPIDDVLTVLEALGLNPQQVNGMCTVHGFTSMEDFEFIKYEEASSIIKMYNDAYRQVGQKIGFPVQKKLQGFLWWFHDRRKRGLDIDVADLDTATLKTAIEECTAAKSSKEADSISFEPQQIKTGLGWYDWKDAFEAGMEVCKGVDNDPLFRVIRPEKPATWTVADAKSDIERLVYELPLTGITFKQDSKIVLGYIQKACLGTNTYEWIRSYIDVEDARGAYHALVEMCEGEAENNKRVVLATRTISLDPSGGGIFYSNEYAYTFEKYYTRLFEAYNVIERYQFGHAPQAKVQRLLDGIKVPNTPITIAMAKNHVLDNYLADWRAAVSYMATKIAIQFPPRSSGHKRKQYDRKASEAKTGGRGRGGRGGRFGRGGGRGRGRGGRGRGGRGGRGQGGRHDPQNNFYNGVDCSNHKRFFSEEEMTRMGREGRDFIFEKREADGGRRQVNAIERQPQSDDMSQITEPVQAIVPYNGNGKPNNNIDNASTSSTTNNNMNGNKGGRGGTGFGRGMYN